MSALKSDLPTFSALPAATRAYVAAVVFLGAACVVAAAANLRLEQPVLFAGAARARDRHVGGEDRAAARPQPLERSRSRTS